MDAYRRGVSVGTSRILFFMVPFTLYLVAFAQPLVVLLAAGKFSASDIDMTASYLRALSVSLAPYAVVMYLQKVCSSLRRMGLYASAHVVAAAIQTAICLALTPAFGLNVVAWSSAVYMVAVLAVTFWNPRPPMVRLRFQKVTASTATM